MAYMLSADWHGHNWSQFASLDKEGVNSRLRHILSEIERMAKTAQEQGVTRLYVAGDVFHVRGQVKPSVLNPVWEMIDHCCRTYGVEWRIMPGNHDLEGKETTWLGSAIVSLGGIDGVEIIDSPTIFWDDAVVMIPWISGREETLHTLKILRDKINEEDDGDPQDFDVLMHTGISDVLANVPGHFNATELAGWGFKRVLSGHYHDRKSFCDGGVWSIGALNHQTWSDVGTRAGFLHVLDMDVIEFDSHAPQFLDFDPGDIDDQGNGFKRYSGHYVRIKGIDLEEGDIKAIRQALEDVGAAGVVVHAVPKNKVVARNGSTVAQGASLESSVQSFVTDGGYEEGVGKLALEVLHEARST